MSHEHKVIEPKPFEFSSTLKGLFIGMMVVGVVVFVASIFLGQKHAAWNGYLIGFWFTFSLAVGGPFFLTTQHLTQAAWSMPIRRIFESYGEFIYYSFVLFLGLLAVGGSEIYLWWDMNAVLTDPILAKKSDWFLKSTFLPLALSGFVSVSVSYYLMRKESLAQDEKPSRRASMMNQVYSVVFLLSFIYTFSILAWYLIMGLDPHWFSTMFSVYAFAGMFQSTLALGVILLLFAIQQGTFGDFAGERQVHDLGQLLFGFTVFYAYIAFCQFLLIWYANIPEEATWYLARGYIGDTKTGWEVFTLVLPVFKFIVPFLVLLPQANKKNKMNILRSVAFGIVLLQLYEVWYWVAPQSHVPGKFATDPSFMHMSIELLVAFGFFGGFLYVLFRSLAKENSVPINDPYLREGTQGHHHGVKAPEPKNMVISK